MSKESQTELSKNAAPSNSPNKSLSMPTTPIQEVKWGTQELIKILPRDVSRLRFQVSNGEEYSVTNSIKLWVQRLTGESWD